MPNGRNRHHDEDDVLRRTDDPNASEEDEPATLTDVVNPENEREKARSAGVIHTEDTSLSTSEGGGWVVDVGIDVVGSCGHKIGEVVDVRDEYLVVEKGFFMPEDLYVPKSAISDADEHHLKLKVTKEAVDHSDWDEDPYEQIDAEPIPPQQRRAS